MASKTDKKESKPKEGEAIHDELAAKRQKLVDDLAAVDEQIAEAAEAARTGDV